MMQIISNLQIPEFKLKYDEGDKSLTLTPKQSIMRIIDLSNNYRAFYSYDPDQRNLSSIVAHIKANSYYFYEQAPIPYTYKSLNLQTIGQILHEFLF